MHKYVIKVRGYIQHLDEIIFYQQFSQFFNKIQAVNTKNAIAFDLQNMLSFKGRTKEILKEVKTVVGFREKNIRQRLQNEQQNKGTYW